MKIVFALTGNGSRSNFVNGELMRYGKSGISGTDTSTILVAEYLASKGNYVVICLEKPNDILISQFNTNGYYFNPGDNINGVYYTYFDLEGIIDREFDILVSSLWFNDYNNLPIKINKAVIYWCHLAWPYYTNELIDYVNNNNIKLGYLNISKWGVIHHQETVEYIKGRIDNVILDIIPNAMTLDVMREVHNKKLDRIDKKVIFPAQWSRGGDVAYKAVLELGWQSNFKRFDYVDISNGVDKLTLFTELATSDYFIFPQYTPNGYVYKDMHSCAMAEAIGMGVVVLSYPLGSHEEYYGGYYEKLDFPPNIDLDKMITERVTHEPKMDYHENIIQKINYLEQNPNIKDDYRKRGIEYIFNTFDIKIIGKKWEEFLQKFY